MTAGVGTLLYCAPEVLQGGLYFKPCDVWSFAVVLWELGSRAVPDLLRVVEEDTGEALRGPASSAMLRYLQQGRRLPLAEGWPQFWYSLIGDCWATLPESRPSFQQIERRLDDPDAARSMLLLDRRASQSTSQESAIEAGQGGHASSRSQ